MQVADRTLRSRMAALGQLVLSRSRNFPLKRIRDLNTALMMMAFEWEVDKSRAIEDIVYNSGRAKLHAAFFWYLGFRGNRFDRGVFDLSLFVQANFDLAINSLYDWIREYYDHFDLHKENLAMIEYLFQERIHCEDDSHTAGIQFRYSALAAAMLHLVLRSHRDKTVRNRIVHVTGHTRQAVREELRYLCGTALPLSFRLMVWDSSDVETDVPPPYKYNWPFCPPEVLAAEAAAAEASRREAAAAVAAVVAQAPLPEAPTVDAPMVVVQAPTVEAAVAEAPMVEAAVAEAPMVEAPAAEAPEADASTAAAPLSEAPMPEAPMPEAPMPEAQMPEAQMPEAPTPQEPVVEVGKAVEVVEVPVVQDVQRATSVEADDSNAIEVSAATVARAETLVAAVQDTPAAEEQAAAEVAGASGVDECQGGGAVEEAVASAE
ncbi:hypothetical protein HDU84_009639, partial [Entophlyctis sp. JEL0112]